MPESIPDEAEAEDTKIRGECPFCKGIYCLRGGEVEHSYPTCVEFETNVPRVYLDNVRKEEAKHASKS